MTELSQFSADLLAEVPRLRAFGMSLTGSRSAADDLVQETLMKAWAHRTSFEMGTNLRGWLFTILRNTFRSEWRKRGREISDGGDIMENVSTPARQHGHLDVAATRDALPKLPLLQREALILVGVVGYSYAEAAAICKTAEGTIKSRVSRARRRLAELLDVVEPREIGPNAADLAVLCLPVTGKSIV